LLSLSLLVVVVLLFLLSLLHRCRCHKPDACRGRPTHCRGVAVPLDGGGGRDCCGVWGQASHGADVEVIVVGRKGASLS
jgi:hypothetical protein